MNELFLKSMFSYNPETGDIARVKDSNGRTCHDKHCGHITANGYLRLNVGGTGIMAHRVIWFLYYNKWPSGEIDHINGIRNDNRIVNLRDINHRVNNQNRTKNREGKIPGYWYDVFHEKYKSEIYVNHKKIALGTYETKEEAIAAYCAAVQVVEAILTPEQ
jgi:hypothetical protein